MGGMGDQNSGDLTIPVEVMDDQNAGDIVDDDATTPACHPSIRKCVVCSRHLPFCAKFGLLTISNADEYLPGGDGRPECWKY